MIVTRGLGRGDQGSLVASGLTRRSLVGVLTDALVMYVYAPLAGLSGDTLSVTWQQMLLHPLRDAIAWCSGLLTAAPRRSSTQTSTLAATMDAQVGGALHTLPPSSKDPR